MYIKKIPQKQMKHKLQLLYGQFIVKCVCVYQQIIYKQMLFN
jgi:hypothetical protein